MLLYWYTFITLDITVMIRRLKVLHINFLSLLYALITRHDNITLPPYAFSSTSRLHNTTYASQRHTINTRINLYFHFISILICHSPFSIHTASIISDIFSGVYDAFLIFFIITRKLSSDEIGHIRFFWYRYSISIFHDIGELWEFTALIFDSTFDIWMAPSIPHHQYQPFKAGMPVYTIFQPMPIGIFMRACYKVIPARGISLRIEFSQQGK